LRTALGVCLLHVSIIISISQLFVAWDTPIYSKVLK